MRKLLLLTFIAVGFHHGCAQSAFLIIPDITDYRTSKLTIMDSLKTYLSSEEPFWWHIQFSNPNDGYTRTDNLATTTVPYESPLLMRNLYKVRPDYLEGYKKYNLGKDNKGALIGASLFNALTGWYQSKNSTGFK
jgi:hypothetical protein